MGETMIPVRMAGDETERLRGSGDTSGFMFIWDLHIFAAASPDTILEQV